MSILISALREANKSDSTQNLTSWCEDQEFPDELVVSIYQGVESFVWSEKNKASEDEDACGEAIDCIEFYFDKGFQKALDARIMKKGQEKTLDRFFSIHTEGIREREMAVRKGGAKALRTSFEAYFDTVGSKKKAMKLLKRKKLIAPNKKKK